MSTSIEVFAHHWAFAIYLIGALGLCSLMLLGAYYLGGRSQARAKHIPYESGINSVGSARLRISAKFYLVAMFLLFSMLKRYSFMRGQSLLKKVVG